MKKKTLIINGSPRINGDSAFLINELRKHLRGEIIELSAYRSNIAPCIDCRACWKKRGCVIKDDMRVIYDDDFDNVVLVSPIYMSCLTPPLMAVASRFQSYYCAKRFLENDFSPAQKKASLILVGGGDGSPTPAINIAEWMFKQMNARGYREYRVFSLKTDSIPTREDKEAISRLPNLAKWLEE